MSQVEHREVRPFGQGHEASKAQGQPDPITNLSQPPPGRLPLLQAGEIVVVLRHIGHDGAFIWMPGCHVLCVQQLGNAQLLLSHAEGKGQVI